MYVHLAFDTNSNTFKRSKPWALQPFRTRPPSTVGAVRRKRSASRWCRLSPSPAGLGPFIRPELEANPHSLWWGTRSAVWAGARRYKAAVVEARKKRKLQLHGLAFQTRAIGDFWNSLGDRQCHVIVDGVVHTGQAGRQCGMLLATRY